MADLEFAYTAHGNVNWYNYEKLLDSTALTMHMSWVSDSIYRHIPYRNAYKYSSQTQNTHSSATCDSSKLQTTYININININIS